ncbi:MAG TPA: CHAT domain-containing tetratricopeptide repeat protein [Bacteroidales bacterium]|nr:CHAT domain-containing tetratricopeptide repeat protein [Bacteroidales bacterium]
MSARRNRLIRFFIFICLVNLVLPDVFCTDYFAVKDPTLSDNNKNVQPEIPLNLSDLKTLNYSLRDKLTKNELVTGKKIVDEIEKRIYEGIQDTLLLAESCYYVGIYYKLINETDLTLKYLDLTISLKESIHSFDDIYSKALYNLGGTFSRLGSFEMHKALTIKALEVEKSIFGPESPEVISTYASLITAYIELKQYTKALEFTDIACRIADLNVKTADPGHIAFLFNNIGVLYNSTGDYSRSKIFLEKAEEFYNKSGYHSVEGKVNLMHSMSNSLRNLGDLQKSKRYYEKGIELAMKDYSLSSYQVLSLYATNLGRDSKLKEGEAVLNDLLTRVTKRAGINSRDYYEVLTFYAEFLHNFEIDDERALELYGKCIKYFDKKGDSFLKYNVKIGCASILSDKHKYKEALELLQTLLFPSDSLQTGIDIMDNPGIQNINADKDMLEVLQTKYQILRKFNAEFPQQKILGATSNTSELIIALLDKIRINISEEESRLLLGNRYRNSYLTVINDFYSLFLHTGNDYYLEKAFEYAEKSKIASLLTATRELKATQFHVPAELADKERELQSEIALLNDRISGKSYVENKTDDLVKTWKDNLFLTVRKRDSLVKVFEKEYPDYYSIKYNTHVITPSMIPGLIGKSNNYISFVVSDTNIFISVVNKKFNKLLSVKVDTVFFESVKQFRRILSSPDFNKAGDDYNNYRITGFSIYETLFAPIKEYLISDRLLISPDNLLSYIPFETLPVNRDLVEKLSYKKIKYMMEEYDISYTYSATLLADNKGQNKKHGSDAIAFAPDYSEPVNIENLFKIRQQQGNILQDLPFAKNEAEYVSKILGGKLLLNGYAKESVFKSEASNYDIIHLAMHTVLDDTDPMYSTLIFSPETSGVDDRYLRTYEIYGIPLKSRMVVLSSCNTGSGKLFSGEGILSLARGFIYSGSESVVMSMWEIEDRAGTEIVKLYYYYLKKGFSKSKALRKARFEFLKSADQLRAHPYFWSTLVIYGDNSALFKPKWIYFLFTFLVAFAIIALYYGKRRRYS